MPAINKQPLVKHVAREDTVRSLAQDFNTGSLRQIADAAAEYAEILRRMSGGNTAKERSAIWKFHSLAEAIKRVIAMQE